MRASYRHKHVQLGAWIRCCGAYKMPLGHGMDPQCVLRIIDTVRGDEDVKLFVSVDAAILRRRCIAVMW